MRANETHFLFKMLSSELEFVGDFGSNVLEADRGSRNALEADTIERKPRQLADFYFPLQTIIRSESRELLSVDS